MKLCRRNPHIEEHVATCGGGFERVALRIQLCQHRLGDSATKSGYQREKGDVNLHNPEGGVGVIDGLGAG